MVKKVLLKIIHYKCSISDITTSHIQNITLSQRKPEKTE